MTFTGTLKPYQVEPVETFLERGNLLVAYEMGLGKTVIGIAAAESLLDSDSITCCVVVCPASLKFQWEERILQFTDHLAETDVIVIDGDPAHRKQEWERIRQYHPKYVIMSYEMVIIDDAQLVNVHPEMVILDEATAIKSFKAKRTKKIKKILSVPYRMGLTGTPIENRPDELYSIMQWVDPKILGRFDLYDKSYVTRNNSGWVVAYKNLPVLRKRLGPAMSRKSRHDPEVARYLPDVDEGNWLFYGNEDYDRLYRKMAQDTLNEMDMHSSDFDYAAYYAGEGGENSPLGKAMGIMTCMEMFIDHPDLLILSGQRVEAGDTGSSYAYRIWQDGLLDSIFDSPKMFALKEKLEDILEYPDSKVLIYTKYRHMLPILQDSISAGSVLFHGQMNSRQRTDAVSQFREDSNTRLFLSSHAGAYGMDMSMANYLINYDLAWSSGRADQINGRHVRASSEFGKVYIRNLVMKNTLDMYKLGLLRLKRSIMTEALDGHGGDDAGRVEMSQVSLSRHLTDAVTYGILK